MYGRVGMSSLAANFSFSSKFLPSRSFLHCMARHKFQLPPQEQNASLDISSLIDVCFLLLIYFLVATTIQKREVDVPAQFAAERMDLMPADIDPLRVNIHNDGSISCGSENSSAITLETNANARELPHLEAFLQDYKNHLGSQNALVQIRVANDVEQQRVMDVLNALLSKEISQVAFVDDGKSL